MRNRGLLALQRALGAGLHFIVWPLCLVLLLLTPQLRSPLLLKVRILAAVAALVGGTMLTLLALRRLRDASQRSRRQRLAAWVLGLGGLLIAGMVPAVELRFGATRRAVLAAPQSERTRLARHVMAGFRSWADARFLVENDLVGGLYVGLHNGSDLSLDELRTRLHELLALRASHGLPRLLIAVDQEGGPVSRLSPPLPLQPALSSVIFSGGDEPEAADGRSAGAGRLSAEQRARARAYGVKQAAALRPLGVSINFAPVVDLRLHPERGLLDRYTHIGSRAISADPELTAEVAVAYAEGLQSLGIAATAKHFPGLGRVQADTHFFAASLDTPAAELRAADWRPFRAVLATGASLLMLGHVYVREVDPGNLASSSERVVGGLVRGEWGHDGVVITDDLCMAPAYYARGGVGGSAARALAAGVDLVLVSYDGQQVFPVLAALLLAQRAGAIPEAALSRSDARLDRLAAQLHSLPDGSATRE